MTGNLVKYETIPTNATTYEEQVAIVELMRRLACTPGVADRLMRCLERFPEMERCLTGFEDRCRTTQQRCDSIEMLCQNFLCPGNVNFSQRTIDEYSNRSLVKLKEIVQNLGGDFVNAFPVPPGKKIRLTHKETLAVVISNNGGANNLDSAHVNVWYDNSRFYELCKARCACK
ncbi:MAG: hypothetical protein IPK80_28575 [Nannocystis sp.]|nr:hypothetical protein [Nannocystis sp.]